MSRFSNYFVLCNSPNRKISLDRYGKVIQDHYAPGKTGAKGQPRTKTTPRSADDLDMEMDSCKFACTRQQKALYSLTGICKNIILHLNCKRKCHHSIYTRIHTHIYNCYMMNLQSTMSCELYWNYRQVYAVVISFSGFWKSIFNESRVSHQFGIFPGYCGL